MVKTLPEDFDVSSEGLDDDETVIRDKLQLNVSNWVRFRYTIHVGVDSSNLLSKTCNPVSDAVKEVYLELGKSHYAVVISLGCTKLSLDLAQSASEYLPSFLPFKKSVKDFYFHVGCLLDNLARLIYIVNDPDCITAMCGKQLKRHRIDWGMLNNYPGYSRIKKSEHLQEIIHIRHALTHDWACPMFYRQTDSSLLWPIAIRKKRAFYWPIEEITLMRGKYRKWIPLLEMIREDFTFIEEFQELIFGKLVRSVLNFEKAHNVTII